MTQPVTEISKVKLKINGKDVEAPPGTLVIEAAKQVGAYVPHYCYHPALGNPAVCRLCMVEVAGMPKLQPACRLPVAPNMDVKTNSAPALSAQQASLEFHLVNHPLDCPVCDQAGECHLQDYYMQVGLYKSSVREDKNHKDKRIPIGQHVMLDQERCILCTRCTRFLDNVTKTSELGIFNRGDKDVLAPYPGMTVDNAYSANITDICPVGALTERDFRFKVRVWMLKSTPSVCTGCSRGCAIDLQSTTRLWHTQGKRVGRYKPRQNPEVNGYWMCDEGRYGADYHDEHRLGHFRRKEGGEFKRLEPKAALSALASELKRLGEENGSKGLAVVLSGRLSNEDLFAAKKLFMETLDARILINPEPDQVGEEDAILRKREKVPNLRGARAMGFEDWDWRDLRESILRGELWGLYVVDRDPTKAWGDGTAKLVSKLPLVVYQGTNSNAFTPLAHFSLGATSHGEEEGTFTNFEGQVQKYRKAFAPLAQAMSDWRIFGELLSGLDEKPGFETAEELFAELAAKEPAFRGLKWDELEPNGKHLSDLKTAQRAAR